MASSAFYKFNQFIEDINKGVHNLGTGGDTIKILLTNTAPNVGDTIVNDSLTPCQVQSVSNAPEIGAGNGYTKGGIQVTAQQAEQVAGLLSFYGAAVQWSASGAIGPFRYAVIYNASKGSAGARPVIGYWDYGASISLSTGETFKVGNSNDGTDWTVTYPILTNQ